MPGMRDVARVAQVSLSTVSAVLSDSDKYVSEEIRERVTKAAAEIGYQMPERKKKLMRIYMEMLVAYDSARLFD